MAPTYVLAQLSDSHVRAGAAGDGPAAALEAAVASLLALSRTPDAVLISGDVADPGAPEDYVRVKELLAPLTVPIHVMPGNHDDRAGLRAAFDLPGDADELIQYAVRTGPLRLVCCDTNKDDGDDGEYGAARRDWLRTTLEAEPEMPTIVALHHPPLPSGIDQLDTVGLDPADSEALRVLLAGHPQVRCVVAGHYHRTSAGEVGGRPFVLCPSTYLQAELDLRPGAEIALNTEPTGYLLHAWLGDRLVTHAQPVAPSQPARMPWDLDL